MPKSLSNLQWHEKMLNMPADVLKIPVGLVGLVHSRPHACVMGWQLGLE